MFVSPDRAAEHLKEARGTICRIRVTEEAVALLVLSRLVSGRLRVPVPKLPWHGHGLHASRCAGSPALQRRFMRGAPKRCLQCEPGVPVLMLRCGCAAGAEPAVALPGHRLHVAAARAVREHAHRAAHLRPRAHGAPRQPPQNLSCHSLLQDTSCCFASIKILHSLWPFLRKAANESGKNCYVSSVKPASAPQLVLCVRQACVQAPFLYWHGQYVRLTSHAPRCTAPAAALKGVLHPSQHCTSCSMSRLEGRARLRLRLRFIDTDLSRVGV